MPTGLYISSALSATWLPWLCLAMVGLVWGSCMLQPQYLHGLISNSFASFAVNIAEQVPSLGSQLTQWLFNSILPAIGVYVLVVDSPMDGMELLGWLILISLAIDLGRVIVAAIVQYTFRFGKRIAMAYMRYFSLRSLLSFVLFVVILLAAYTSPDKLWLSLLGVATAGYLVFLGVQWSRLLCTSVTDLFGVIIYLLTVELLPTVLLFEAGKQLYLQQFV